ncbi:hypothetical protein [Enterococcus phage PEF7b]
MLGNPNVKRRGQSAAKGCRNTVKVQRLGYGVQNGQ